ncbi:MAG: hypothetical protein MUO31_15455 [Thermodesulfovibrionales bacterium]|nr:hypothetical protein [Thermodesulfovibrionales bacterium]
MKKASALFFAMLIFSNIYSEMEIRKISSMNQYKIEYRLLGEIEKKLLEFEISPNVFISNEDEIDFLAGIQCDINESGKMLEYMQAINPEKLDKQDKILFKKIYKKVKKHCVLHHDFISFLSNEKFFTADSERISAIVNEVKVKNYIWKSAEIIELKAFIDEKQIKLEEIISKQDIDENNVDLLNYGFIEYGTGNLKGSIRLMKYRIGEPSMFGIKHFNLPLYVFVSAKDTNNALGTNNDTGNSEEMSLAEKNKQAFLELLDPLGGTINFSIYKKLNIATSKFDLSHVQATVQFGGKVIRESENTQEFKTITKVNGYAAIGFYSDTGSWEDGNLSNIGRLYLSSSLMLVYLGEKQNREVFLSNLKPFIINWSSELGWYIKNSINFKLCLLKCFIKTDNPDFQFLNRFYVKAGIAYSFSQ